MVAIGIATLSPATPTPPTGCTPFDLFCGEGAGLDLVYNVLGFLPFGMGLALMGVRWYWALLLSAAFSTGIETAQVWIPGRSPSLDDVLSNALGGTLGFVLGQSYPLLLRPPPRLAARLAVAYGLGLTAVLGLASWMLGASLPATEWYGQWAPDLGQFARFRGRLFSAEVGGMPLPRALIADGDQLRLRLRRNGLDLSARVVPGPPTGWLAPIASIFDQGERKIMILGQRGADLVFEPRTRAEDFGLQPIAVRARGVFEQGPRAGDTLELVGHLEAGWLSAQAWAGSGGSKRKLVEQRLRLSPALLWITLLPSRHAAGPEADLVSAGVLFFLFLPLGYYWALTPGARTPSFRLARWISGALAAGVALAPAAFGFPLAHWSGWFAVAAGGLAGAGLSAVPRTPARRSGPAA